MEVKHQSSGGLKATTPARHLLATAIIGAALIGYQVQRTSDARMRLESLATMAYSLGELTDSDAAVVHRLLAAPPNRRICPSLSLV